MKFLKNIIYQIYYLKFFFFCEKRNASTALGIEPSTFRLRIECSIIWATEVLQNFSHRIYLRHFGHGYIMNYIQIFPNHLSRLKKKVLWNLRSSDNRAFDRQSKGPGVNMQRSGSVPFFTENFFKYILKIWYSSVIMVSDTLF